MNYLSIINRSRSLTREYAEEAIRGDLILSYENAIFTQVLICRRNSTAGLAASPTREVLLLCHRGSRNKPMMALVLNMQGVHK